MAKNSSGIKVDPQALQDAASSMATAANTTRETLSQVVGASQPVDASVLGDAAAASTFYTFWSHFNQQVQISGDVYHQLGKAMGDAGAQYGISDSQVAAGFKPHTSGSGGSSDTPDVPPGTVVGGDMGGGDGGSSAPPPPDGGGDANSGGTGGASDGGGDGSIDTTGTVDTTGGA